MSTTTLASITPIDLEGGSKIEISNGGNEQNNKKQENETNPKTIQYCIIIVLTIIAVALGTALAVVLVKSNSSKSASTTISSGISSKKETKAIQTLFTPNQMYVAAIASKEESDLWNIESAAFRLITSQSSRIYQYERKWCFGESNNKGVDYEDGRPYKYGNFAIHVVSLLDTMEQLQMVPEQCVQRYEPLRQLLLPNRNTTSITFEYVTGNDGPTDDEVPPLEWWEEEFLPTVASAFSCGYRSADDVNTNPRILPGDIRDGFPNSITIRQVWRLVKGYIRSPQKQREGANSQQDFDVSLYVPFLPPKHVPLARVYLGKEDRLDGTSGSNLRVGVPFYQGPAIWYLWHSFASRLTELERSCIGSNNPNHLKVGDNSHSKILSTVKTMVGYFGLTHPCPYCRYHLLSRASRNDANWKELGQGNKVTGLVNGERQLVSESELYPLEYLFLGGSMEEKLQTIVDGPSLMLFFWKIHNAVTASVTGSLRCKTQEESDDPNFSCTAAVNNNNNNNNDDDDNDNSINGIESDGTPATTRNLGRAWPMASRFTFWLRERGDISDYTNDDDDQNSFFDQTRKQLKDAHKQLNQLDRRYGSKVRQQMWTKFNDEQNNTPTATTVNITTTDYEKYNNEIMITEIEQAITELDKSITDMLYTEYLLSYTPYSTSTSTSTSTISINNSSHATNVMMCDSISSSLEIFTPLTVPTPLMDDGNYPWMPEGCKVVNNDDGERSLLGSSTTSFLSGRHDSSCDL
jgi:hypothetical protein